MKSNFISYLTFFLAIIFSSQNPLFSQNKDESNDEVIERSIENLIKEIEKINKDLEEKISKKIEEVVKKNKDYLNQLENEYSSKIKEEYNEISNLKKEVDEILKLKDQELKIIDQKIKEINKNLKDLTSDDYLKDFKKDIKSQLDEFKKLTLESLEKNLNIKVDTLNNEQKK